MFNIKISEKLLKYFDKEHRVDTILKGLTVAACTVSMILILIILFSGQSNGYENPSHELNNAKGSDPDSFSGERVDYRDPDSSDKSIVPEDAKHHESSPLPVPGEERTVTLSLTNDEASDLVSLAFSERFHISDVSILFFAPDTIMVKGFMGKNDLGELFLEQDLPLLRAALILTPDELEGELVFNIALEEDGTLIAMPSHVSVNGVNMTRFIPPAAVESANEALSSLIPEEVSLREITVEDGSITFTLQA